MKHIKKKIVSIRTSIPLKYSLVNFLFSIFFFLPHLSNVLFLLCYCLRGCFVNSIGLSLTCVIPSCNTFLSIEKKGIIVRKCYLSFFYQPSFHSNQHTCIVFLCSLIANFGETLIGIAIGIFSFGDKGFIS